MIAVQTAITIEDVPSIAHEIYQALLSRPATPSDVIRPILARYHTSPDTVMIADILQQQRDPSEAYVVEVLKWVFCIPGSQYLKYQSSVVVRRKISTGIRRGRSQMKTKGHTQAATGEVVVLIKKTTSPTAK